MTTYKRFNGLTDSIINSVREVVTASAKTAAEQKAQDVEKYAAKYENVRPLKEVEKTSRPIERLYASMRPTTTAPKTETIAERVQVLAEQMGTVPKTEKHKQLAALAKPKNRITHADILRGRGVQMAARGGSKGAMNNEEVEQIDEISADTAKSVAQARDRSAVANKMTPTQSRRLKMKDSGGDPDMNAAKALKSAMKRGAKNVYGEEAEHVEEAEKLWPGTAAWKARFGSDREKHELKFGKSDVKPLKPYGEREDAEDSPMSAQTKGRGRPKKVRTEEVEQFDEELTSDQVEKHNQLAVKHRALAKSSGGDTRVAHQRAANLHAGAVKNPWFKKGSSDAFSASKKLGVSEEVEELDEMGPGKLPRIDKKVENEYGDSLMKDFLARGGEVKQVPSPKLPKNRNRFVARGSLSGAERTVTKSGGKSYTGRMGEEKDTPGNDEHQCAIHVKHAKLGEGRTLFSQHAEPAEDGSIEWYDVMFEHGIERVMTNDVEIVVSESHMNHKKKGK